ncbi:hypothetical protein SAMN04488127_2925 [Bhargavaea ginsengi]|uniref:Uncharacterized protein n=1 Tax=Bhargavaea ginsengi TaxID=426757 RepID=A0A1H7BYA9_9BACL|nr:hypothetical protein [Bhargavaea ginsengi]SEJ82451.1 hypothetical protein SAMN04488127_2925 [Bhargavaea ginsengi]
MEIPINREHILKVAEEYGVKVEFDSKTPGVRDPETGEIHSIFNIMKDFLEVPSEELYTTIEFDKSATLKSPSIVHVEDSEKTFTIGVDTLMAS